MNYVRGFKRVYIVVVCCWEVFCVLFLIDVTKGEPRYREDAIIAFGAMAIVAPVLGYILLFRVIPWIARGFK